jgi:hypothetical protein
MAQTIRLNGKLYDASTGKIVSSADQARHSVHRHTAKDVHSRTQSAKTLMRSAVKKPVIRVSAPKRSHASSPAAVTSPIATPTSIYQSREARAKRISQSHLIRRFNSTYNQRPGVATRSEALSVRPAPAAPITHHTTPPVIDLAPSSEANFFASALNGAKAVRTEPTHHKEKLRSHMAKPKRTKAKAITITASIMSVMVFGGFFLWQNSSNVEFRMAASRAGIQASLPKYRPSGFSMTGPVEFAPGQVKVSFSSGGDERKFSITQQSSSWNSDALKETVSAAAPGGYETRQTKGKTVYIFNGSNATWVDGGIWYQIESNSGLDTSQLLNIAASM